MITTEPDRLKLGRVIERRIERDPPATNKFEQKEERGRGKRKKASVKRK